MTKRVRAIAVDMHERFLFGVRRDGVYGLIGGKLDEGERPSDGLVREVLEESGAHIKDLAYQFDYLENSVFLVHVDVSLPLTPFGDPDGEFERLELVYLDPFSPPPLDDYSEAILFAWLKWHNANKVAMSGVLQVYVDEELFMELPDDVIWQTMPRLAQERAKGRKISYKQRMDNGEVQDFSVTPFPSYFSPMNRLRVMGEDTGLALPKGRAVVGIESHIGSHLDLLDDAGGRLSLRNEQLSLDAQYLDVADLEVTAHDPFTEAQVLLSELIAEHFAGFPLPNLVTVHGADFIAATRYANGAAYIVLDDSYLTSPHLRQILAHELVHCVLFEEHGEDEATPWSERELSGHGQLFDDMADRINAVEGKDFVSRVADRTSWQT
jgi:8-oxo-dGTP pyrophosphatase MutT (NUDIX family)